MLADASSGFVEPAQLLGVGDQVHGDDSLLREGEAQDGDRATRAAYDETRAAVDERRARQARKRSALGQDTLGDRLRALDRWARSAAAGAGVGAEDHLAI